MTLGLLLIAVPASAQIITTSIPLAESSTAGGNAAAQEKKFAIHFMASPASKWRYNELALAEWKNVPEDIKPDSVVDIGSFSGTPNSDFLLAGEAIGKIGRSLTVGVGGWHNRVGTVRYTFDVNTYIVTPTDEWRSIDKHVTGTLAGDLSLSEVHANVFYKNVGIQAGLVHTISKLTDSIIDNDPKFPDNEGSPLKSIEGSTNRATDWDVYGVYKIAGQYGQPFAASLGAGLYDKTGNDTTTQRLSENELIFSWFVTASVDLHKGLGIDASYWYIGKTSGTSGMGFTDAASRFTVGIGYSFSR